MKNVSHKKTRNLGVTQVHVELPPTPLIKGKHDDKSDNYLVTIKFCRYPTSATSDLYEFNMDLFKNLEPE